ncbi:MAG: methyltransferase domain-containing protein [Pirellulaceae bacterium]|nr:methyltransferase domain-containing protein [Pirellulaceae bacterium]
MPNAAKIFMISALGLFLELMLIRWIGTEIRIFAYLQNTVLIVCFLGLGIGCFTCRKQASLRQILIPLLALTAILSIPQTRYVAAKITNLLSVMSDLLIWESALNAGVWTTIYRVSLGLALTLSLMALLWEVFVPIGRILGRAIDSHDNVIQAYSINVLGSLVGICLFVLLSSYWFPPIVWVASAAVMAACFLGSSSNRKLEVALLVALVGVVWIGDKSQPVQELAWSPYQKLEMTDQIPSHSVWAGKQLIKVNNAEYQGIIDLDPERAAQNPAIPKELLGASQYDIPLLLHPQPSNVLMVGAGSGNDVAGALRGGADQVTAVEIDPAIIEMGRRHHPEHPYDSPKVRVVNDDARSFFATTAERYDLIVFGLLDSHTTTAMTNARLDHYVYTRESIRRTKSLLKDGGVMVLSFEALKPFIADRIGSCLEDEFGERPLAFRIPTNPTGWGGVMFVAGDLKRVDACLAENPRIQTLIRQWQQASPVVIAGTTAIATDDWPYLYLESPKIPSLYFLLGALIVALLFYAKYRIGDEVMIGGWRRSEWHFALLGAAFLLLEVQNISKASVVLGNTWQVNAVVISGILCMILLANLVASRFPRLPLAWVGGCLVSSCLVLYYIDLSSFAFLPYPAKALLVGGLTTIPLLFSGIIFARSFKLAESKHRALGANLLGSIAGGMLQSLTFIFGIKALLLLVGALYAIALWCAPSASQRSDQPAADDRQHPEESPAEEEGELVAV